MKIVIAEDDHTSRKVLEHFISALPDYSIVGKAEHGEELIRYLVTERPDIAIVDIGLPLMSGMDAIKSCKSLLPHLQVIFLTGHDQYAVEALGINAADYIVKPIDFGRLKQALDRAVLLSKSVPPPVPEGIPSKGNDKKLVLKHYNSYSIIQFDEIVFIEKVDRKTLIHTKMKVFSYTEPLSDLLKKLSSEFVQSHRSYIINMNYLSNIESIGQSYYAVFHSHDQKAKISKHQIKEVQRILAGL